MYRIAIADDHGIVRAGLRKVVEQAPDLVLVGEAVDGPSLVAVLLGSDVDVCVTDLDMPGGGLPFVQRLVALRPGLRVLVLSQHAERDFALRALAAGAHGYVNKEVEAAELGAAIRQVASGRRYLSDEARELALERLVHGAPADEPPHARLSGRELEVMLGLAHGRRVTDLAVELGISFKTVSTHRAHVLQKIGVESNTELALYAREHGLI